MNLQRVLIALFLIGCVSPVRAGSLDWLGFNRDFADGWVWNEDLGFLHPAESGWLWSVDQEWIWAADGSYPWIFHNKKRSWLLNLRDFSGWFFRLENFSWDYLPSNPRLYLQGLGNLPESVSLEAGELTLDPYLWRDFMPSIGPRESRGLMASLELRANKPVEAFPELDITAAWIFQPETSRLWRVKTVVEDPPAIDPLSRHGSVIRKVIRKGPAWETGIRVSVVVKVSIEGEPEPILLRADGVVIEQTW